MIQKVKEFLLKLNDKGIAVPLLRDNKTGSGSYTLTMFVVSFNLTILFKLGKITQFVGEVDFWEMLALTGMMGSFYLGRKYQSSKDGGTSVGGATENSGNVEPPA